MIVMAASKHTLPRRDLSVKPTILVVERYLSGDERYLCARFVGPMSSMT
jgi:hypothetical protein